MAQQTLKEFKAQQRKETQELINSGEWINEVTGFKHNRYADSEVTNADIKKFKKRWVKNLNKD